MNGRAQITNTSLLTKFIHLMQFHPNPNRIRFGTQARCEIRAEVKGPGIT